MLKYLESEIDYGFLSGVIERPIHADHMAFIEGVYNSDIDQGFDFVVQEYLSKVASMDEKHS